MRVTAGTAHVGHMPGDSVWMSMFSAALGTQPLMQSRSSGLEQPGSNPDAAHTSSARPLPCSAQSKMVASFPSHTRKPATMGRSGSARDPGPYVYSRPSLPAASARSEQGCDEHAKAERRRTHA